MNTGFDPMELTIATEELYTAFASLSDEHRQMAEVIEVMENVSLSMQTLKSCGAEAIKVLNIDKSLENLVGVSEDKLTVQKAQESLSDVAKKAFKTAVDALKAFIAKIRNWARAFVRYVHAFRIKILALDGTLNELALPGCPVPPKDSGPKMRQYIHSTWKMLEDVHGKYGYVTSDKLEANPNLEKEFNEELEKVCTAQGINDEGGIPSRISDEFMDGTKLNWRECGYTRYRDIIDAANTGMNYVANIIDLVEYTAKNCTKQVEDDQKWIDKYGESVHFDFVKFCIKVNNKILNVANRVLAIAAKYTSVWKAVIDGANKSTKNPETWRIGRL